MFCPDFHVYGLVTLLGFKFTQSCLLIPYFLFVKKVKFDFVVYLIVLCIKIVEL
jgi:hypothetical protein